MAIKNILMHAFAGPGAEAVESAVFGLAETHGADVVALGVVDNTPIPAYVVPYVPANLAENYLDDARATMTEVEARVHDHAKKAGANLEWRYVEGDIRGVMGRHSRYADLCVVCQGAGKDMPVTPATNLPDELVFSSGRPVMTIPATGNFSTIGKNVLVAWNGSAQASRAVHDALPILAGADLVRVVSVAPEKVDHLPGADICAHLAQHGIKAEAAHLVEDDNRTSAAIIKDLREFGADLLVAGAWGHSRFMEIVLGGVTRDLLRNPPVPVLMSH